MEGWKGKCEIGKQSCCPDLEDGVHAACSIVTYSPSLLQEERKAARKRLRILRQYPIHFDYRHRVCTVDRGAGAILSTLPVESQHNSNQLGGREEQAFYSIEKVLLLQLCAPN